jgi:hypothetical protein
VTIPSATIIPMHQLLRSPETLWRAVCAVLASSLDLSDATITELSAHACTLREQVPADRLAQIDAERFQRVKLTQS